MTFVRSGKCKFTFPFFLKEKQEENKQKKMVVGGHVTEVKSMWKELQYENQTQERDGQIN